MDYSDNQGWKCRQKSKNRNIKSRPFIQNNQHHQAQVAYGRYSSRDAPVRYSLSRKDKYTIGSGCFVYKDDSDDINRNQNKETPDWRFLDRVEFIKYFFSSGFPAEQPVPFFQVSILLFQSQRQSGNTLPDPSGQGELSDVRRYLEPLRRSGFRTQSPITPQHNLNYTIFLFVCKW